MTIENIKRIYIPEDLTDPNSLRRAWEVERVKVKADGSVRMRLRPLDEYQFTAKVQVQYSTGTSDGGE